MWLSFEAKFCSRGITAGKVRLVAPAVMPLSKRFA
jgi:hypothetical protein